MRLRESGLRWRRQAPLLVAVVLVCAGCGHSSRTGGATDGALFAALPGPHQKGALLVDELHGRVSRIRFGLPLARVGEVMPRNRLWLGQHPGGFDLVYCSRPSRNTCAGAWLAVNGEEPNPAVASNIHAIYLIGGSDPTYRGGALQGTDAITLKGIRIGSSLARVKARYAIAFTGRSCISTGEMYYAAAGRNLVGFSIDQRRVTSIILLRGRHLRC